LIPQFEAYKKISKSRPSLNIKKNVFMYPCTRYIINILILF
jgi:hypothetical protein